MQINNIEHLVWDSKFFKYDVARVALNHQGLDQLESIFRQLEAKKIRLTYIYVHPKEEEIINYISKSGAILMDQKVVFEKTTEKHFLFNNEIIEFEKTEMNEKLRELALQAGLFSRFRLDENFIHNEYERLYTEWLRKSLNKTISFKTLVAYEENEVIGLATLGEKDLFADIGIVAVSEKFRGKEVGYDLIRTADSLAYDKGIKEIKVVTQHKNRPACKLYEKCNFKIEEITNIYHYWL